MSSGRVSPRYSMGSSSRHVLSTDQPTTPTGPLVLLLGETFPPAVTLGIQPLALQVFHSRALIDHWWISLQSAGFASIDRIYVVTNAVHYKAFEFWALGKGLDVSHVVNSGRTLGDTRVDLSATLQALRLARARTPGGDALDVLVIAADSAPTHAGLSAGLLTTLARHADSAVLLQPATASSASASSGPAIVAEHVDARPRSGSSSGAATTSASITAATAVTTSSGAAYSITDVSLSTDPSSEAKEPSSSCSFVPLVFGLKASDCTALLQPEMRRALIRSGGEPVEAALRHLARSGRLSGVRLGEPFRVGGADGRPHGEHAASDVAVEDEAPAIGFSNALYRHGSGAPPIHTVAYARVGVLGNPADGYGGKTASTTIANFKAEAWLTPGAAGDGRVVLQPHPLFDPLSFANAAQLAAIAAREGYSGGVRLMAATVHRLTKHLTARGATPRSDSGFTLKYHTTVPRQVGLAGSSAIVTALLRALLRFYGYGTEAAAASIGLAVHELPNFVLAIESEELGITAGLQDRVVQSYEGFIHMDFVPFFAGAQPWGNYTRLRTAALPPLFLAYAADPSDSGKIHAPVKQRWLAGDEVVVAGMKRISAMADEALRLATETPYCDAATVREKESIASQWGTAMTTNFDTRRSLWGDAALGVDNLRMVAIAREVGAAGKFPGSGGAILGVIDVAGIAAKGLLPADAPPPEASTDAEVVEVAASRVSAAELVLREAYHAEGFVFIRLQPYEREAADNS